MTITSYTDKNIFQQPKYYPPNVLGLKISNIKFTVITSSGKETAFCTSHRKQWKHKTNVKRTQPCFMEPKTHSTRNRATVCKYLQLWTTEFILWTVLNALNGQLSWTTHSQYQVMYWYLIHQQHLHPFLRLTQTMGVANPFPFCCSRKEALQRPTFWIGSQSKRKGLLQLSSSQMPLPFSFLWACSRDHGDQEKDLWISPFLLFLRAIKCYSVCHISFSKTIS